MTGYVTNIEQETLHNDYFRKVLFTGPNCQLVVMSIQPGEDIGEEVHHLDQFIRIESGEGEAQLDGETHRLGDNYAVVIPAGTRHNIINRSTTEPLKLYTVYAPPQHEPGTIHKTRAEAMEAEVEHGHKKS